MQNKIMLLNFFSFTNKYMQFSTFDFMWIYFVRSSVLYGKCSHHFRIFERYNTKLRTGHFQQRWHHHQARRPGRLVWDVFYLNHTHPPTHPIRPFAQKGTNFYYQLLDIANTEAIQFINWNFKIIWRIITKIFSVFCF